MDGMRRDVHSSCLIFYRVALGTVEILRAFSTAPATTAELSAAPTTQTSRVTVSEPPLQIGT
jgi:hypothetical protein